MIRVAMLLIVSTLPAGSVEAQLRRTALCVDDGTGKILMLTPNALSTNRTLYLPAPAAANTLLLTSDPGQTIRGSLTLGVANSTTGSLVLLNAGNSNTLTLQAGATAGNLTFTLPASYGSNGQLLQTDGAGQLSWTSASGAYIINSTSQQTSANFNIDGAGVIGTSLTVPTIYGGTSSTALATLRGSSNASPTYDSVSLRTGTSGGLGLGARRVTLTNRHIRVDQSTAATIAGVGATVTNTTSSRLTDVAGIMIFDLNGTTGQSIRVTFATTFQNAPVVVVAPTTNQASTDYAKIHIVSTTTYFDIVLDANLNHTGYGFSYMVMEIP